MKNFEELKQAIMGNSFNESSLSRTQVVDLETVIGLIEDFEQCNIANVVKQRELLVALAQYICKHQNNLDGKTAKDYVQDFLSQ